MTIKQDVINLLKAGKQTEIFILLAEQLDNLKEEINNLKK